MADKTRDEEAIFNAVIKLKKGPKREAYLAKACGSDSKLRADIEALLQAHQAKSLIDKPIFDPDVTMDSSPLTEGPGTIIGNYKLLEQIGEGGMAVVYMAEQERPLRRRVALKIIKLGMDTKQVIARFEAERQALAVMDHPNIAKVLDAGSTETGRPYFVMELVRGVSISEYCDKNKLDTKERLDLFIQVCNAVQHAHQKGIIHRDIKPSNVMVTLHDGKPVPKVIDFGIAKATSQRLTEKTLFTRYAQMIGTPAYMSPEQAEMSGLDIDTRTDIYSLGILLYELLTGVTPFSEEQLREAGYVEMQRIIREEEPLKPSTKLSTLGDTLTDVAAHRKASPDLLQKLVRGDLDWIVMKSLEKDRTHRYDTAAELVADIARHLNHEPVLAGPPSQIYRLRKFIRRHRTHAIGAAMVTMLLAGMIMVSLMYFQARSRGKEAESLKHKDILSKAMEFRSRGKFQDAMNKVETMLSSKHVGPEARLLRARLILELQGPADAVKELEKLINERDEIACQAHLLLARIYLESASGDPEKTQGYQQKAKEYQQKGEKLFHETAEAYFNQAMIVGTVTKTLEYLNKAVELEPSHYPSRRARALAYYALRDYRGMERDAVAMAALRGWDSLGYSLLGISLRETENFTDAVKYHNKAIEISPDEAELYDQRRRTHMRTANFEQALSDARKCVELEPEKGIYQFHVFCSLVALGRYDKATAEYETIIESGLMNKQDLDLSAAKYVSDTLDAGLSWHPPQSKPEGAAFLAMHESAEIYHQLAKKAKRVVPEGFHATWSPDGRWLAYSRGVLGSSGIEILNLESGKTRLLVTPGKDPDWSSDGKYIAYVRDRQMLLLGDIPKESMGRHRSFAQEEVWIMKVDGTEEPRFLARGGWPCWSSDSQRIFYHSRVDNKLCSISIEDGAKPTTIIPCPRYPAVSPDDKYVAYTMTNEPWRNELRIVEISSKSIVASWTGPMGIQFTDWSPNGRQLSVGGGPGAHAGLWIYEPDTKTASMVLIGSFGRSSWSSVVMSKMAIDRSYWGRHYEIWVADTASLRPDRTLEDYYQEMVDFYTRRIDFEPGEAGHYLSRAGCYMYLEEQGKVFVDLEKYADIVKDPPKIALAYGNLTEDQVLANPQIALQRFQRAHEIQPKGWLVGLGVAHYRANQWEEAIEALTKAIKLPRGVYSWARVSLLLSMAHWQSGNKAEAANWYNKAIERIQDLKTDISSVWWPLFHSYYLEAVELMGIRAKGFHRKAPLTGKQIMSVTARANSSHLDMTVEHILDGNSLSDADRDGLLEHGETQEDMWLSETSPTNSWVEFDLGDRYELGSILVWNYNRRDYTKQGIKRADISVWTQDNGWQKIFDDFEFSEAEGSFDYDDPTVVRFDGVKAEKVRFDDLFSFGDEDYVGLSEVRFFQRRGPRAVRPYPSDNTDIAAPTKLSWTPGLGVKAHKVYFGTSPDNLRHLDQVEEPNCVDMPKLKQGQRYFWRVDVVKSDGSEVKGDLWTFSTGRMVGWWKFDETEGRTAYDSSGFNNNGTLMGDPQWKAGQVDGALEFDGIDDYVNCWNNPSLNITGSVTVSAWIKLSATNVDQKVAANQDGIAGGYKMSVFTNNKAEFEIRTSTNEAFTNRHEGDGTVLMPGVWYHVVGVYSQGNYIRTYVNRNLDRESVTVGVLASTSSIFKIGCESFRNFYFFNGLIDDVRIYSYALSEAEIKELYAGRGPGPSDKPD